MFVINPDPYSLPTYRIGPFRTSDISKNNNLPEDISIDSYFEQRFKNQYFSYVINGRNAMAKAFAYYNLKKDDTVTILTSSGNFYISSCVTKEIEKHCKWSREIVESTKIIFVNHEFGVPYENLCDLKKYNVPIIEDCAHSFYSKDKNQSIGTVGDFIIYSFPKMFPIQIGGLLVSNIEHELDKKSYVDADTLKYIKNVLSFYNNQRNLVIEKRIEVYKKMRKALQTLGITERFELKKGMVPGVYMFNVNNDALDLSKLKIYLWEHGIHCSVFYGERAFYIPNHQNLTDDDILYFKTVIESFLKK